MLKRAKSGDRLKIPAATFNAFIDAARAHRDRQHAAGGQPHPASRDAGIVHLRNDSGADRQRFDVLGVSEPIFSPSDDLEAFQNNRAVAGVTPSDSTHRGAFVVLLEPIASGEVGRAMAAGVVPVRLNVQDESFQYADISDGDATVLRTCREGSARILWKEEGTGAVWGLVRLGVAPGTEASHTNPKVLGGSGDTTDAETWDAANPPAGTDGVQFAPFRLYWSGTSGDPVYQFVRTATYDSLGRLVAVSAEVRSTAFGTGPCAT